MRRVTACRSCSPGSPAGRLSLAALLACAIACPTACSGDDTPKPTPPRPDVALAPAAPAGGISGGAPAGTIDAARTGDAAIAAIAPTAPTALTEAMVASYWTSPDEQRAAQLFALDHWQPAIAAFEAALR